MKRTIGGATWMLLLSSGTFGQSTPTRAFEVVSVKLHQGPISFSGITTSGVRLNDPADNLLGLIMYAYGLRGFQVSGTAPLSTVDVRYEIVAKAEGIDAPTRAEFRQMMQRLLADRFHLKFHREMREIPVYELVVAKNGPKLKASAPDASPVAHYGPLGRNYQATIPKGAMADLIDSLAGASLGRPVLDKTGLTGTYDIKLIYTPDNKANREDPDLNDISIFTALQEQLGLKLEEKKTAIEVLVVDSAEKPFEN